MNLQSLLSELRRNILYDRSDRTEGDSDILWDDETLVRYIDEAQRKLAREGLVIRDSKTAEVCRVTLATGQAEYDLHPSVIAVVSAKYDTEIQDLKRAGHSLLAGFYRPTEDLFDINAVTTLNPGKPFAFSTDETVVADENGSMGKVSMRVFPTPTAAENGKIVHLRVIRMPIERLSHKHLKVFPEVPEEHHLEMLSWAASLALQVQDQDAGNSSQSDKFAAKFQAVVNTARRNSMRKLFTPQRWGFGNAGWSWEH